MWETSRSTNQGPDLDRILALFRSNPMHLGRLMGLNHHPALHKAKECWKRGLLHLGMRVNRPVLETLTLERPNFEQGNLTGFFDVNGGLCTRHESMISYVLISGRICSCYARGGGCSHKSVNPLKCMGVAGHRSLGLWCGLCASGLPLLKKVLEIDQLASLGCSECCRWSSIVDLIRRNCRNAY